jgi:hypothetical protein
MSTRVEADDPARARSAYVRSFNRFELKYLTAIEAARAFARDLATHARPDPHSGEQGYDVYSLYWDSPELRCFWEKLDGEKYRRKLRFRRYGGDAEAFVEIKQRIDRTVQKRRTRMAVGDALALFGRGAVDPVLEAQAADPVLQEALVLCREHRLAPKAAIRYRRAAWFATFEPDLRVTFDTRLQYDAQELDLAQPFVEGRWLMDPALCVIEIKYNHRVPMWLVALVQKHGLSVVRFSKYCAAVDAADFQGRFDLVPRIR